MTSYVQYVTAESMIVYVVLAIYNYLHGCTEQLHGFSKFQSKCAYYATIR